MPSAVALDAMNRRLFVADSGNHRVLVYNITHGLVDGMPARFVLGQRHFTDNLPNQGGATSERGFNWPRGLQYDPMRHHLWVADTANNRLLVFDLSKGIRNGMQARWVLGQKRMEEGLANRGGGPADDTLNRPKGITLSGAGRAVFVCDVENNRVLVFDLSGGVQSGMSGLSVLGQRDLVSGAPNQGGVNASASSLYHPHAVVLDEGHQRLFVSDTDNSRVVAYDLLPAFPGVTTGQSARLVLGRADLGHPPVSDGFPEATASTMNGPTGMGLLGGRFYVADVRNNRILIFRTVTSSNEAAVDVLGQYSEGDIRRPSFVQQGANDGPTSFEFDHSDGVSGAAVDPRRRLLGICDALNGRVLVFRLEDSGRIASLDRKAAHVLGTSDFQTIGGKAPASEFKIRRPQRLLFDDRNRLFVADDQWNRVLVYDLSHGITDGMAAKYVIGQAAFTSTEPGVGPNRLNRPRGLGYDRRRQWLFVADTNNNRILVYDLSAGITNGMNAASVLGQVDFMRSARNGGRPLSALGMDGPRDPTYDHQAGHLFVADTFNRRVLVFDIGQGIRNGLSAEYVLGQPDFYTNAPAYGQNRLDGAGSLACDPQRHWLYVSNTMGTRTLVFDLAPGVRSGMNAFSVLGQKDFVSNERPTPRRAAGANLAVDANSGTLYAVDQEDDLYHVLMFRVSTPH